MKTVVHQKPLFEETTALAVVFVCEEETLDDTLQSLLEYADFTAKSKETALFYPRGTLPAQRVLLVGLGKQTDVTLQTIRQAAAQASCKAQSLKLPEYSLQIPVVKGLDTQDIAQAVLEGSVLASYRLLEYKSQVEPEEAHKIEQLHLFVDNQGDRVAVQQGVTLGEASVAGVFLTRDLANRLRLH
jgi:leucyl aminopeptidase